MEFEKIQPITPMTCASISIVIPCFNGGSFVGDAIRSALKQTCPPLDVIVVDDGSTDNTLDVLRSFGDDIVWVTGKNRGGGSARNKGLALARGEFVHFLDADDVMEADMVSHMLDYLKRVACDSVVCDQVVTWLDGRTERWPAPTMSDDPIEMALGVECGNSPHVYRTASVRAIGGFREDLSCAQDRDIHLRFAALGHRTGYLPEILIHTRRMPNSVSSNTTKVLSQMAAVIEPVFDHLISMGTMTESRRRAFAAFMARVGKMLLIQHEPSLASRCFVIARRFHPGGGLSSVYSGGRYAVANMIGPVNAYRILNAFRATKSDARNEAIL